MKEEITLEEIDARLSKIAEKVEDTRDLKALLYFIDQIHKHYFMDVREGKNLITKKPKTLNDMYEIYVNDNIKTCQKNIAKVLFFEDHGQIHYLGHFVNIPCYFIDFIKEKPFAIDKSSKYGLIEMYYKVLNSSKISAYEKEPLLESVVRDLNNSAKVNVYNQNVFKPKFLEQYYKSEQKNTQIKSI